MTYKVDWALKTSDNNLKSVKPVHPDVTYKVDWALQTSDNN